MASSTRVKRIWTDYVTRPNGQVIPVDKVEICAVGQGDRSTTIIPISTFKRLRPVSDPNTDLAAVMMHDIWNAIRPAYEAWKQGQEMPENGTPLAAWPGLSPEQAQVLRSAGFRSVEELAEATDSAINRIALPGARNLCENAKRFLAAQDKAKVAAELAEKEAKIAALEADQQEMKALLEELLAEREKPRRGRPPKSEQTEIEAA